MVVAVLRRTAFARTLLGTLMVLAFAVPAVADASARHLGDRVLKAGTHGRTSASSRTSSPAPATRPTSTASSAPATTRGVRKFERSNDRKVDGVVDASDAEALREAASSADGGFQGDQVTPVSDSPTAKASLASDGTAIAPATAPPEVQAVIEAANEIAKKPYGYGGGHGSFNDSGYDCSGSVSFALHGASLVDHPLDSTDFKTGASAARATGSRSTRTRATHSWWVAGLRFDTSGKSRHGSRWQRSSRSPRVTSCAHPDGL